MRFIVGPRGASDGWRFSAAVTRAASGRGRVVVRGCASTLPIFLDAQPRPRQLPVTHWAHRQRQTFPAKPHPAPPAH
jgi:hypothetical protein